MEALFILEIKYCTTLTTCSINNYVLNATHNAGFLFSMCSYIGNAVDAVCDFFINLLS